MCLLLCVPIGVVVASEVLVVIFVSPLPAKTSPPDEVSATIDLVRICIIDAGEKTDSRRSLFRSAANEEASVDDEL